MAWTKKVFKNEGEATETDPRIDAKFLNELQDEIDDFDNFMKEYKKSLFPVGYVLITAIEQNPSTTFGGTWVEFAQGRTLVGVDTTQTEFNSVGKTGGEKDHALTLEELPEHKHPYNKGTYLAAAKGGDYGVQDYVFLNGEQVFTNTVGGNKKHNNLQPYITVYFWKRTA